MIADRMEKIVVVVVVVHANLLVEYRIVREWAHCQSLNWNLMWVVPHQANYHYYLDSLKIQLVFCIHCKYRAWGRKNRVEPDPGLDHPDLMLDFDL